MDARDEWFAEMDVKTNAATALSAAWRGVHTRKVEPQSKVVARRIELLRRWREGFKRVRIRLAATRCLRIEAIYVAELRPHYKKHDTYLNKLRLGMALGHRVIDLFEEKKAHLMAKSAMEMAETHHTKRGQAVVPSPASNTRVHLISTPRAHLRALSS